MGKGSKSRKAGKPRAKSVTGKSAEAGTPSVGKPDALPAQDRDPERRRVRDLAIMDMKRADRAGVPPAPPTVRDVFHARSQRLVREIAERAPERLLAEALAEPSAMGTLARAMAAVVQTGEVLGEADRLKAAALAEGARFKAELLDQVGGAYTAAQLAEFVGVSRQAIAEGRKTNRYFGVPTATGFLYPKVQMTPSGILRGLRDVLDAFQTTDEWGWLMVLASPSPRLGGRTPFEAIEAGDVDAARMVAATYGEHGA